MIAVIRISPFQPTAGTPPFFGTDKERMVKACNRSLLAAGECTKVYLLDDCPDDWAEYFSRFGTVHRGKWGKKGSLFTAYEVAKTFRENILFLEDDYLWRPHTLQLLDAAVSRFGMCSPYDHADAYGEEKNVCEVYTFGGHLWRRNMSNTHTFAVTPQIFTDNIDLFYYGMHDWQMFFKLSTVGLRLFTPMYPMATHMVEGKLALNVDWESLMRWYDEHHEYDRTAIVKA